MNHAVGQMRNRNSVDFFRPSRTISSMSRSGRFVEVVGSSWNEIGASLAALVVKKSLFAYRYDRAMYDDEPDIQKLWQVELADTARKSMMVATPNAYELCSGFNTVFSLEGAGFSVWELLTLYEVDMFLHEFHYKCRHCKCRIMKGARYICGDCNPTDSGSSSGSDTNSPVKKRAPALKKQKKKPSHTSVCSDCVTTHPYCIECGDSVPLVGTTVLHETSGVGIANKAGCTGFAYRNKDMYMCGQTLEMATDTYNYGRFDTVYKLINTTTDITVLVYDVGCILSPFGINSSRLGMCIFNLYNSDYSLPPYAENEVRVPMASLQWEVLLRGSKDVGDTLAFLRGANGDGGGIKTFTSASFVLAADNDCAVIEVTADKHWVPPVNDDEGEDNQPASVMIGKSNESKCIVRANNCLAGSCLIQSESLPPNISSMQRQADLTESFMLNGNATPSVEWTKAALSTPTIQTDYCLGTIVMEPQELKMHVRFRVGTRISTTLKNGGRWDTFTI